MGEGLHKMETLLVELHSGTEELALHSFLHRFPLFKLPCVLLASSVNMEASLGG